MRCALFVRVAELGSFAAVAQQLGVARSVVTRQVAALEAHLGVKLMVRSTRRLTLTSAGTAYLEKCRVILNLVEPRKPTSPKSADTARPYPHRPAAQLRPEAAGAGAARVRAALSGGRAWTWITPIAASNLIEEGIDLSIRITSRLESCRRGAQARLVPDDDRCLARVPRASRDAATTVGSRRARMPRLHGGFESRRVAVHAGRSHRDRLRTAAG